MALASLAFLAHRGIVLTHSRDRILSVLYPVLFYLCYFIIIFPVITTIRTDLDYCWRLIQLNNFNGEFHRAAYNPTRFPIMLFVHFHKYLYPHIFCSLQQDQIIMLQSCSSPCKYFDIPQQQQNFLENCVLAATNKDIMSPGRCQLPFHSPVSMI